MSTQNNKTVKITRARLTQDTKNNIDEALQHRGNSTLKDIAARFNVSIGAVAVRAKILGLTKVRVTKTDTVV